MKFSWARFFYLIGAFLFVGTVAGYYVVATSMRSDWFILVVPAGLLVGLAVINGFLGKDGET